VPLLAIGGEYQRIFGMAVERKQNQAHGLAL